VDTAQDRRNTSTGERAQVDAPFNTRVFEDGRRRHGDQLDQGDFTSTRWSPYLEKYEVQDAKGEPVIT